MAFVGFSIYIILGFYVYLGQYHFELKSKKEVGVSPSRSRVPCYDSYDFLCYLVMLVSSRGGNV